MCSGKYRLSGRDAAFTTELAAGTIRRQGTYDAILAACTDRPLASTPAKVLDILRLGSHQLLSMRVAPHAAISTSVDLVRSEVGPGPAGFANAVLRRVSAHDLEEWLTRLDADRSVRFSHPAWVVDALTEAVGGDEVDALLAADNDPPAVTLVARPGRSTVDELPGEPTTYSPYGVVSSGGSPGDVPAVASGTRRRPGRGFAAGRPRARRRSDRGSRRAVARPVRGPRRQGRPARGPRCRAWRPARRQRESSPTGPSWCVAHWPAPTASRR